MPLYEYECDDCGHRTEVLQRFSDAPLTECPECRGAVRRLISAPAVQFKGTGWYVTDYGGKKPHGDSSGTSDDKSGDTSDKASSSSDKSAEKGSSSGASAKSEAKSEKKAATVKSAD